MEEYLVIVKAVLAGSVILTSIYYVRRHMQYLRRKSAEEFSKNLGADRVEVAADGCVTFSFHMKDALLTFSQRVAGGKNTYVKTELSTYLRLDKGQKQQIGFGKVGDVLLSFTPDEKLFSYEGPNFLVKKLKETARKAAGIQDITIGDTELDDRFVIKGISEDFVLSLCTDTVITQMKNLLSKASFSITLTGGSIALVRNTGDLDSDFYKAATILILTLKEQLQDVSTP